MTTNRSRLHTVRLYAAALGVAAAVSGTALLGAGSASAATTCNPGDGHAQAMCNFMNDNVMSFTAPGSSATGHFDLTNVQDTMAWGHDSDDDGWEHTADATLSYPGGYQAAQKNSGAAAGVESDVAYTPAGAPFTENDQVGYHAEVQYIGIDKFSTTVNSDYLFADMVQPGDLHAGQVTSTTTFSDRPLAIQIHNGLPGVTLTKVGTETSAGLLMDPNGTDQDPTTGVGTIAAADANQSGMAYFGGYRSGSHDATFQATYEVAPPTDPTDQTSEQYLLRNTQITLNVHVDVDDPTKQESTCTVSSPTSLTTVNCSATQGGSNGGQSLVAFSITQP
jgi:hypothetical protein